MFANIEAKLIAAAVLLIALAAATIEFGAHERSIGAESVQAKWDAAKTVQLQAVATAQEQADIQATTMRDNFNALAAKYEAMQHAQAPSVADSVTAGVSAGTLRLRDDTTCPDSHGVSKASAHSRALDAASTQALADRVAAAVEIIRIGDAADAREFKLGAQVTSLQDALKAERKP